MIKYLFVILAAVFTANLYISSVIYTERVKKSPKVPAEPEFIHDQKAACEMFLWCLCGEKGKKVGRRTPGGGFIRKLMYDDIFIMPITEGGMATTRADIQMPIGCSLDHAIVLAIKRFGKNGSLTVNMGPFIYPKSCSQFTASEKNAKSEVTLTLLKK